MKPAIQTLGQLLYSPSQYVIPVFQRHYRWASPQWQQLWDSFVEIQSPTKRGNHFMGFLVFVSGLAQPGKNNTFHLVDGQQRLATLSILLAAIRNVARREGSAELADEIHQYYLVHPLKKGDEYYRLLPKERDHDAYLALVSGGTPTGLMAGALGYFEDKLSAHAGGSLERLRQVFDTLCQRLEFMCATLETENAYNIFKSLNSTGIPLGPADLIRNFVFMHIPPDDQDEFDHDLWAPLEDRFARSDGTLDEELFSRFFRDFLISKPGSGYISPADTFPSFESRYEATGFSPVALGKALTTSARHYAIISGQQPDQNVDVTLALAGLNQLESSTTYPVLLALFEQRAVGAISHDQLAQAIDSLSGFILRRFVRGESSRGYGRMFARAVGKEGDDPFELLEPYLVKRGWPDDRRFKAAFVEFPLYQRGYTREVLMTLEHSRGHREPADLKDTEIEHILPQTLNDAWREALGPDAERIHSEWLHRPGNLTLSGYNLPLWNHPFEKKRKRYAQSNIVLTRELADYERWTEDQIRERGARLAEEAAKIWIGPKEQTVRVPLRSDDDDDGGGRQSLSKTQKLQLKYWSEFMPRLSAKSKSIRQRAPLPQMWMEFAIGRSGLTLQALMSLRRRHVGVSLMIVGPNKAAYYQQLHAQKSEIEAEMGESLTWFELPDKKSSYISLYLRDSDPNDRAQWPEQQQWMIAKLDALYRCFSGRVKSLFVPGEPTVEPSA